VIHLHRCTGSLQSYRCTGVVQGYRVTSILLVIRGAVVVKGTMELYNCIGVQEYQLGTGVVQGVYLL